MNLTVGAGDEANADERPEREVVYTHQGVQARSCRVIRGEGIRSLSSLLHTRIGNISLVTRHTTSSTRPAFSAFSVCWASS